MIFTKRMNIKLTVIGVTFMGLLILTNGILMEFGLNRSVEFTYNAHYEDAEKKLNNDVQLLKRIVERLAENKKVIETLESNKEYSDLDSIEKEVITNEIQGFEGYLKNLIFIDTINIVSAPGKYLFSKGGIINYFDLMARPWMKDEIFEMKGKSFITKVHKDYNTEKYVISVVRFIYSQYDGSLLGAAIVDIFLDDLISELNSNFYMGKLNAYLKVDEDKYYYKNGVINKRNKENSNYIVKLDDVLKNGTEIYLEFDKDSVIYTREMRRINRLRIGIFSVAGIVYVLVLIYLVRATFKPILKSLDKLKVLLNNLEKDSFELDTKDEFKQLEFISNSLSLSLSFDKKIQSLIYYDELTKIPNRKLLVKMCNDLIDGGVKFALIFIDLNRFKYINDIYGHGVGDEVLVKFSEKMDKCLGDNGIITRYSGDEFIIIYHRYIDNDELEEFYHNVILEEFKEPILISNDKKMLVEFSAGVAVYPKDAEKFDDLIDKSDFMMYSNKRGTDKAKILFFNDDIYNKILRIELIKEQLKTAVDKNELVLYYQPIVNKDRKIKKLEALIRWNNEKLGFVSPIDFIGYAEETGEIIKIGYWIVEEVCRNFSELFNNGQINQVSINVSPVQIMEFDFVDKIREITDRYNVSLSNLCFEITESVVLDGNIIVYDNISSLHKLGANIALDDFGTGYASFSYLKKFRLNILKIDKIFIDSCGEVDYKIIYNIKNIAHLLNMKIVIEGVETEGQFDALSKVGCDYFQGYYFSKPVELNDVLNMI